jgi:PAS domain S-box-containing protein
VANISSSTPAPLFDLDFHGVLALSFMLSALQAVLVFTLKPHVGLTTYRNIADLFSVFLLLLAMAIAARNGRRSPHTIRLFWSFYAVACGLWTLSAYRWVFHGAIVGKAKPDDLLAGGSRFLYVVFLIAAAASSPHRKRSTDQPFRTAPIVPPSFLLGVAACVLVRLPGSYMPWGVTLLLGGCFMWVTLEGRQKEPQLTQAVRGDNAKPTQAESLVMLASVAIPIAGVSDLLRADELYAAKAIRVLMVLLVIWFLAFAVFFVDYFSKREWSFDIGLTRGRPRLAVPYGATVGWDLDARTTPGRCSGDPQTTFGTPSNILFTQVRDVYRCLHPDDRRGEQGLQGIPEELLEAQRVAQLGSWQWDRSRDALTWSKQLYRIHGLDPTQPVPSYRKDLRQLFVPESWRRLHAAIRKAIETGSIEELDLEIVRPDGSKRWVAARGEAVRDANGRVTLLRGTVQDITQRKHIEDELRESQSRLDAVVGSAMDAIIALDREQRVILFNPGAEKMFGYSAKAAMGVPVERFLPERFRVELGRHIRRLVESGTTNRAIGALGTLYGVRSNGEEFPIDASISHLPAEGHELFTVIIRDATERCQAEDALRESERRYRHLVDSSNDFVWEVDAEGVYTYASPQCREILGYEPEELIGKTRFDFMSPEESRRVAALFNAMAAERKAFRGLENINVHKDGHLVVLETNGVPVTDEEGKLQGYRGMDRDVTTRRQAEQAVRESEERFRLVANTAPVMIWMAGPDKLSNYFNQTWLEFRGRPLEAELGNGWVEGVHPRDSKACLDIYNRAFDRHESFQMRYRLRRYDGDYRWILDIGVPRVNPDGSFAGYIGSCIDITDRKLAEETLAGIGRRLIEAHEEERAWIARELHDDINQRIALLAIELEQLTQYLPQSAAEHPNPIRQARQRLSEIGNDIQALSHRLHSSKLEYLGIAVAASSFCKELSEQQKVEIDFSDVDIPRSLPKEISLCLFRVLQEALQNAVKHSGVRYFRVEMRGTTEEIRLTVSDHGVGFDQQNVMNSPGLGLISMRERLQWVNGEFSIKSRAGHGTTIYARVPLPAKQLRASLAG